MSSFSRDTSTRVPHHTTGPDSIFVVPFDYVPGKFPTSIREKSEETDVPPMSSPFSTASMPSARSDSSGRSTDSIHSSGLMEEDLAAQHSRPASIYDNLPDGDGTTPQQLLDILQSPGIMTAERILVNDSGVFLSHESLDRGNKNQSNWSVDDILEHTKSLEKMVKSWEEGLDGGGKHHKENTSGNLQSLENIDDSSKTTNSVAAISVEVSLLFNPLVWLYFFLIIS